VQHGLEVGEADELRGEPAEAERAGCPLGVQALDRRVDDRRGEHEQEQDQEGADEQRDRAAPPVPAGRAPRASTGGVAGRVRADMARLSLQLA
jgi:hypothetical protein